MSDTYQQNLVKRIKADRKVLDNGTFTDLCRSLKTSSHSPELLQAILKLDASVFNRVTDHKIPLSELIMDRNFSLKYTSDQLFKIFSKSNLIIQSLRNTSPLIVKIVRYSKEFNLSLSAEQTFSLIDKLDNINIMFGKQSLAMLLLQENNLDLNKKQMMTVLQKCDFTIPNQGLGFSAIGNLLASFNPQFKEPLSLEDISDVLINNNQTKVMPQILFLFCLNDPQKGETLIKDNAALFHHYKMSEFMENFIAKYPNKLPSQDVEKIQTLIDKVTLEQNSLFSTNNKVKIL